MKERPLDPLRLDLPALCRQGAVLEGTWPQQELPRLSEGLQATRADTLPPPVRWRAQGLTRAVKGGEPELWLALQADTVVALQCQRCLQPMTETLVVDRRFRFVADEDEAARLDETSEDDVLALSGRLDLRALVEDELILALPLVPRHGQCPKPLPVGPAVDADAPGPDARPNPFAALARLRAKTVDTDADPGGGPSADPAPPPRRR
jgi:uncharacterized protein